MGPITQLNRLTVYTTAILLAHLLLKSTSAQQAKDAKADSMPSVRVGMFLQETPIQYSSSDDPQLENCGPLFFDDQQCINVRTDRGVYRFSSEVSGNQAQWQARKDLNMPPATQIIRSGASEYWLATDRGVCIWDKKQTKTVGLDSLTVNSIALGSEGQFAAATSGGLYEFNNSNWSKVEIYDQLGRLWAARDVRAVVYDAQGQLWVAQLAGLACRTAEGWKFYEGKDGLPYSDFTCAAAGTDGRVWFGTHIGVVGFDGAKFFYREGPRFMRGNDVRSIVVDHEGTPWVATDKGIAALKRTKMSLADKAAHYEKQIDRYIKRTEFGYTSEVRLKAPGDFSQIEYSDSDNDGLWTAMYGASQCYAAAVTGSEHHKVSAKKAFEAIRFLQVVTQGGSKSPPPGFIARTILPTDGRNPNDGQLERDRQTQARGDKKWKSYDPRWPTSADGKWYWKSDTSSDELDGHYFFLPLYYDLVADDESEKDRVRKVVRDLTDHIIEHNYQLIDVDGTATRWAVFNPENLNQNPQWWEGRGLNSLSILAYLTVAEHMTGDQKYTKAIESLRKQHSYEANAMVPKVQFGRGTGNQSDDEMAIMNFYSLLEYTQDDQLRRTMRFSMFGYWSLVSSARNPFFHFAYAHHGLGHEHQTPHTTIPLSPWEGWLQDSIDTLTGFPLDRLNWPQRNSHRIDLVELPRTRGSKLRAGEHMERGHLVDGKVLPIENRHFNHWNADAWRLDYPGSGQELASGTVFLLPYYMGRYHGFIVE